MEHIRKKNTYFVTNLLSIKKKQNIFGLSALRAPTVGPFSVTIGLTGLKP